MAKKLKTKTLKLNSRVFPDSLRFSLNSRVFQDAGNPVLKPDRKRGNLTKIRFFDLCRHTGKLRLKKKPS